MSDILNDSILTLFDSTDQKQTSNHFYHEGILRILRKILPDYFPVEGSEPLMSLEKQSAILKRQIPLICTSGGAHGTDTLSFFCLSKYRPNAFKFFFEMISRWLVSEKRLNVLLVYATDFRFAYLPDEVYTICEVMVRLRGEEELAEIQRNFSMIQTEIAMGIHSHFYSQKIMEVKGLSADDKIAAIQEFITLLIKRFSNLYDQELFAEMQYVLVRSRDDFKQNRKVYHLSRIITIQYLFRRSLREAIKKAPDQRSLILKIFRSTIKSFAGLKKVLSIVVGFNLLKGQETFGQKALLKIVQSFIPNVHLVPDSFFMDRLGSENMCLGYLEIEKIENASFTKEEIKTLYKELPTALQNHIQPRLHKVFTHRNEEEIMRNIVTLSDQLRYLRDIPQVLITFDEQAYTDLYFTVTVVRILKEGNKESIQELFQKKETKSHYIHDRVKNVGFIRKKHPKEATVFRLKIAKDEFLRSDQLIDLYKARQALVEELYQIIGDFRDYNGGMIANESRLLNALHSLLSKKMIDYDKLLLENFFYGLNPIARSLIDPLFFKTLFLMLKESIKENEKRKMVHDTAISFFVAKTNFGIKEKNFEELLKKTGIISSEFAVSSIFHKESFWTSFICTSHDLEKRKKLYDLLIEIGY